MLLSLGLELPKTIFVHGFITANGEKMSKSLGNVINPFELVEKYGADAVRYYLLREIPPADDGDFSLEKFTARYNADLAGGIGNLLARVKKLADNLGVKSGKNIKNKEFKKEIEKTENDYKKLLEEFKFNDSLKSIWDLITWCNKYIDEKKPWETKDADVISDLLVALDKISQFVLPFLPETSEKIKSQLFSKESKPLFPRI